MEGYARIFKNPVVVLSFLYSAPSQALVLWNTVIRVIDKVFVTYTVFTINMKCYKISCTHIIKHESKPVIIFKNLFISKFQSKILIFYYFFTKFEFCKRSGEFYNRIFIMYLDISGLFKTILSLLSDRTLYP